MLGSRNLLIDALRGACIFTVLCTHGLFLHRDQAAWMSALHKGYYAVIVFFAISGFLIMSNTLKRYGEPAHIDFGQFYTMRAARILPCLIIFVVLMVWCAYHYVSFRVVDLHLLWVAAYAALTFQFNQYYVMASESGLAHWTPLWSLAIEEIFYLAFPLACFFTSKRWALILILVGLVLQGCHAREINGMFSFWSAADVLALGCMAAMAAHSLTPWLLRHRWVGRVLVFIGLAVMVYIFATVKVETHISWTPTVIGLGAALFLIGASTMKGSVVLHPPAAFGRCSYEVYIFHSALLIVLIEPVLRQFRPWGWSDFHTWLMTSTVILGIIWLLCYILARLVSEPLNRLIRNCYKPKVV